MVGLVIFRKPIVIRKGSALYLGAEDLIIDDCTFYPNGLYRFEHMDSDLNGDQYVRVLINETQ